MKRITHINHKISKPLERAYAASFGSDIYIGQSHTHCLREFNHEFFYTIAFYELKWGVPDLYHIEKLNLKYRLMSEIVVLKMNKLLKI